jgi:hypothetical protein
MLDLLWAGCLRQLPFSMMSGSGIPGVFSLYAEAGNSLFDEHNLGHSPNNAAPEIDQLSSTPSGGRH